MRGGSFKASAFLFVRAGGIEAELPFAGNCHGRDLPNSKNLIGY